MIIVILLLALIPLGIFLFDKKLNQGRNVASDGSLTNGEVIAENDLSDATPEEFRKAFKYQILKSVEVEETSAGPGLSLGIFLLKDANGKKIFACDKYKTIDLTFAAEGVAFSGEIPKMIVRGTCLVNSDQSHIEAFPIPFAKILAAPVGQTEFQSEIPGSQEVVKIYFRNVVEFWPTEWNWVGVTLYGDNQENLSINGYEVISVLGAPLVLKAKAAP